MPRFLARPSIKFQSKSVPTYHLNPSLPRRVIKSVHDLAVRSKADAQKATQFHDHAVSNIEQLCAGYQDATDAVAALNLEVRALRTAKSLILNRNTEIPAPVADHGLVKLAIELGPREEQIRSADDTVDTGYYDLTVLLAETTAAAEKSLETALANRKKLFPVTHEAILSNLGKCKDVGAAMRVLQQKSNAERWLIYLDIPDGYSGFGMASDHLSAAGEAFPQKDYRVSGVNYPGRFGVN